MNSLEMTSVEKVNKDYQAISEFLLSYKSVSLLNDFNDYFRKILIISGGSFFENQITKILLEFVNKKSGNDQRIVNFLQKQAISQKYHTLFDWGEKDNPDKPRENAKQFWKLFGEDFRNEIEDNIKTRPEIEVSIKAFMTIGHLRNILIHSNFAEYVYEQKTPQEIFDLYKAALPFLVFLKEKLN
jgi:hypothetical protein